MSFPDQVWLNITEQLVPGDEKVALCSLASLAQTSSHLNQLVSTALYRLDAKNKSYALYWASVTGNIETLRQALDAGADANTRWLVARNCHAEDMIADSEYVGDGVMEVFEDDDLEYNGGDRFWSIPELEMAFALPQRQICKTTSALGRMLYAREEARLSDAIQDPAQRDLLRDAHLMRDGYVDEPVTTAVFVMVSALHIAAHLGHTDVVEELLERGADVNLPMRSLCPSSSPDWLDNTITALNIAIGEGHGELVEKLLVRGGRLGAVIV